MEKIKPVDQAVEAALEVLLRYRHEVPLGHQPHMLAHTADEVIAAIRATLASQQEVVAPVTRINLDDEAWLEQSGPLPRWALYNPTDGFVRYLSRFESQFINSALHAASRVPVAADDSGEKGRWEQHVEGHWNHYDAQGKLDMQSVSVALPAYRAGNYNGELTQDAPTPPVGAGYKETK